MDSIKDRQISYLATERSSRRDRRKRGEAQLHLPMKRGRAALTPWTTLGRSLTRSVTGKLSLTLPHLGMEVSPLHGQGGQPWDKVEKPGPWKTGQKDWNFIQGASESIRCVEGQP